MQSWIRCETRRVVRNSYAIIYHLLTLSDVLAAATPAAASVSEIRVAIFIQKWLQFRKLFPAGALKAYEKRNRKQEKDG